MSKVNKQILSVIIGLIIVLSAVTTCSYFIAISNVDIQLKRSDWNDDVKKGVNDMLKVYGKGGAKAYKDSYAVFDFDNTSSIFDVEEQLLIFQLQTMTFEISPDDMQNVLLSGIPEPDRDVSEYGLFNGSFSDLASDISASYAKLWERYGGFNHNGVDKATREKLANDIDWQEFSTKTAFMYYAIGKVCSSDVAYPWVTYLFKGMTEEEVYNMALKGLNEYSKVDTSEVTWKSPEAYDSKTGVLTHKWVSGISVTENIKELWKALDENNIDVWVCSASYIGVIKAAIDYFGLHNYCKGVIAMTDEVDTDGHIVNKYDYETGCGYYTSGSKWKKMNNPTKSQTQGKGKVTAIDNAIRVDYDNREPIACFMDSTGDFNFCTEYKDTKLVICFNRADRKVTEGGGLIAIVSLYQRDTLGLDFDKTDANGDTLYLLQGRDETGKRTFRNSSKTIKLSGEERLLYNEDNYALLQRITDSKMNTKDTLDMYAVYKTPDENGLPFATGFLKEYVGYHSR